MDTHLEELRSLVPTSEGRSQPLEDKLEVLRKSQRMYWYALCKCHPVRLLSVSNIWSQRRNLYRVSSTMRLCAKKIQ
jgi:hypothetical protein